MESPPECLFSVKLEVIGNLNTETQNTETLNTETPFFLQIMKLLIKTFLKNSSQFNHYICLQTVPMNYRKQVSKSKVKYFVAFFRHYLKRLLMFLKGWRTLIKKKIDLKKSVWSNTLVKKPNFRFLALGHAPTFYVSKYDWSFHLRILVWNMHPQIKLKRLRKVWIWVFR